MCDWRGCNKPAVYVCLWGRAEPQQARGYCR